MRWPPTSRTGGTNSGGKSLPRMARLRCNDAHELQGKRPRTTRRRPRQPGRDRPEVRHREHKSRGWKHPRRVSRRPTLPGLLRDRDPALVRSRPEGDPVEPACTKRMADRSFARLRPRVFLFENVRGLLNAKWTKEGGEPIWPDVFAEFESNPWVRGALEARLREGLRRCAEPTARAAWSGSGRTLSPHRRDLMDPDAHPEDAVKCGFLRQSAGERPLPRPGRPSRATSLTTASRRFLRSQDFPKRRVRNRDVPPETEARRRRGAATSRRNGRRT